MNLLGWRISLRRKRSGAPSAFAAVLPRVRGMREHCDWPPTTIPAAQQQRRERVEQARRRIIYRPEPYEPYETAPELTRHFSISGPAWSRLLWYVVPFGLLAAGVAWVVLTSESEVRTVSRGFTYQLPGAVPFLTENLALAKAKEALSHVVPDPNGWHPVPMQDKKVRTAPDGTPDVYLVRFMSSIPNAGFLAFTNAQHLDQLWSVNVELRGPSVLCTVSRVR